MSLPAEYWSVMRRAAAAERRGNAKDAKAWLDIAARYERLSSHVKNEKRAHEKHEAFQDERPHRLRSIKRRGDYPR